MATRSALKSYNSKYPTKLDIDALTDNEWRKERTLELYDFLPQTTLEERFTYTDIRDEVVFLNYSFFGYVASRTYVNNTTVTYEDKLQSALLHFCEIWHKFKFASQYRTDLSFSVFFKPRISEEIQREMTTVRYSFERSIKMEAGKQLGKHWAQVQYEDLKNLKMSGHKMQSLQAIFGCMYWADLDTHALFIQAPVQSTGEDADHLFSTNYDTIEDMLIYEMIERECLLDDKVLHHISEVQDIPIEELQDARPKAEYKLYRKLQESITVQEAFQ